MAKQLETMLAKLEQVSSEFKSGMVAHNTLEHSLEHNRAQLAILVWRRTQTPRAEKLLTKAKNLAYRIGVLSLSMEKCLFALDSIMYEGDDDEGRQVFRTARRQQVQTAQTLISQLDQLRAKALRQQRVFAALLAKAARTSKQNKMNEEVKSDRNSEVSNEGNTVSNEISHETGSKVNEVSTDKLEAEPKADSVQQRTADELTSQTTAMQCEESEEGQTVTSSETIPEQMQITEEQNLDELNNDRQESDSSDKSDSDESEGEELEEAEDILPKQESQPKSPPRPNVANPPTRQSPVHRSNPHQAHDLRGLDLLDLLGGYYPEVRHSHTRQPPTRQESPRSHHAPRYARRGPPSATRRPASCYPQRRAEDYFYPSMYGPSRPCRSQDSPFFSSPFYPTFHPVSFW
jgi:hypothetical protein